MANLTHISRSRARSLRQHENTAEQILWGALRARRLGGIKFVRQLPIGPYFADFAAREMKLVVEIDGATHGSEAEIEHDSKRDGFLRSEGWQVLRLGNLDVYENLAGACDMILSLRERS